MRIPRTFTSIASPIWRNSSTTPDERRTTQHRNFAQAASCVPGARLADSTRATWTVSRAGDGRRGAARGAPRCGGEDGDPRPAGEGASGWRLDAKARRTPPGGGRDPLWWTRDTTQDHAG